MNSKKVGGMSVIKDAAGAMKGRLIDFGERDLLLSQFADRFQKPTQIGEQFTMGKIQSNTGIGFRQLPGEAIFGVIVTCPENDCEFMVYADAEPEEAQPVIDALGGVGTFTEEVVHSGNTYSASYPGGSGMWEMTCLPPNK